MSLSRLLFVTLVALFSASALAGMDDASLASQGAQSRIGASRLNADDQSNSSTSFNPFHGLFGSVSQTFEKKPVDPYACVCRNWKEVYANANEGAICGKANELFFDHGSHHPSPRQMKEAKDKHKEVYCSQFFERLDSNMCLNVNVGEDKGQWCYVDKACTELNGGMSTSGSPSWKMCDEEMDMRSRERTPEELADLAIASDVDLGLLHKMSYPLMTGKGLYWEDVQSLWAEHPYQQNQGFNLRTITDALFKTRAHQMKTIIDNGVTVSFDTRNDHHTPHRIVVGRNVYAVSPTGHGSLAHPGTWNELKCASDYSMVSTFASCSDAHANKRFNLVRSELRSSGEHEETHVPNFKVPESLVEKIKDPQSEETRLKESPPEGEDSPAPTEAEAAPEQQAQPETNATVTHQSLSDEKRQEVKKLVDEAEKLAAKVAVDEQRLADQKHALDEEKEKLAAKQAEEQKRLAEEKADAANATKVKTDVAQAVKTAVDERAAKTMPADLQQKEDLVEAKLVTPDEKATYLDAMRRKLNEQRMQLSIQMDRQKMDEEELATLAAERGLDREKMRAAVRMHESHDTAASATPYDGEISRMNAEKARLMDEIAAEKLLAKDNELKVLEAEKQVQSLTDEKQKLEIEKQTLADEKRAQALEHLEVQHKLEQITMERNKLLETQGNSFKTPIEPNEDDKQWRMDEMGQAALSEDRVEKVAEIAVLKQKQSDVERQVPQMREEKRQQLADARQHIHAEDALRQLTEEQKIQIQKLTAQNAELVASKASRQLENTQSSRDQETHPVVQKLDEEKNTWMHSQKMTSREQNTGDQKLAKPPSKRLRLDEMARDAPKSDDQVDQLVEDDLVKEKHLSGLSPKIMQLEEIDVTQVGNHSHFGAAEDNVTDHERGPALSNLALLPQRLERLRQALRKQQRLPSASEEVKPNLRR
eukprot:gnl/TRDRNA2_/TRDRNA2_176792_c0_seq2.p1 gnl/TRDRNA2_/TRDRNA2_176792_c0~~gnl/TRDRNA2_/TRDRNA2_176792_c0_seq2.p1  ORF type:complete len:934 (-),score=220.99 gnl/TRDRNA2_/TRDRNA2_176792_c0_seq2:221-3022(-)